MLQGNQLWNLKVQTKSHLFSRWSHAPGWEAWWPKVGPGATTAGEPHQVPYPLQWPYSPTDWKAPAAWDDRFLIWGQGAILKWKWPSPPGALAFLPCAFLSCYVCQYLRKRPVYVTDLSWCISFWLSSNFLLYITFFFFWMTNQGWEGSA